MADEQYRKYHAGKYEVQDTDVDLRRYQEGGHTKQMKEGMLEVIERMGGGLISRNVKRRDKQAEDTYE